MISGIILRRTKSIIKALSIVLCFLVAYMFGAAIFLYVVQPWPDASRVVSSSEEFVINDVTVQARIDLKNVDGDIFAGKAISGNVLIRTINQSELTPLSVSNATMELLFENAARSIDDGSDLLPSWLEIPRIGQGRWKANITLILQSSGSCGIDLKMVSPNGSTQIINFKQPIIAESWGAYRDYSDRMISPSIDVITFGAPFVIFIAALIIDLKMREEDKRSG